MELNELKSTWQTLEKALERGNLLSMAMLRQQKLEAANKSLRPLKLNQAFQIFFGVLFIALAAMLWSTKPTAISVVLAGVAVQAYGIGCIITAGVVSDSHSPHDVEMIKLIAARCRTHGVAAGISCSDALDAKRWEQAGYTMLALPSDAALLGDGLARTLAQARSSDG